MKVMECAVCGNQALFLNDSGVPMMCCGEPMGALVAGAKDAALEKHVPVVSVSAGAMQVQVGEVLHPMTPEHSIKWIAVEQGSSVQIAYLTPSDEPKASFSVASGAYTVYEFCNLHGLWKAEGTA